jgi:hypothetical protein
VTEPALDPDLAIGELAETDNTAKASDGDQHVAQEPGSAYDPTGEPVEA